MALIHPKLACTMLQNIIIRAYKTVPVVLKPLCILPLRFQTPSFEMMPSAVRLTLLLNIITNIPNLQASPRVRKLNRHVQSSQREKDKNNNQNFTGLDRKHPCTGRVNGIPTKLQLAQSIYRPISRRDEGAILLWRLSGGPSSIRRGAGAE